MKVTTGELSISHCLFFSQRAISRACRDVEGMPVVSPIPVVSLAQFRHRSKADEELEVVDCEVDAEGLDPLSESMIAIYPQVS